MQSQERAPNLSPDTWVWFNQHPGLSSGHAWPGYRYPDVHLPSRGSQPTGQRDVGKHRTGWRGRGREADPTPSSCLGDCELRSRGAGAPRERMHPTAGLPPRELWASGWRQAHTPVVSAALVQLPASPSVDHILSCGRGWEQAGRATDQVLTKHRELVCWHLTGVGWRGDGPAPVLYQSALLCGHPRSSRPQSAVGLRGKSSGRSEQNGPQSRCSWGSSLILKV